MNAEDRAVKVQAGNNRQQIMETKVTSHLETKVTSYDDEASFLNANPILNADPLLVDFDALFLQMLALTSEGAAAPSASKAQKWQMGDMLATIAKRLGQAQADILDPQQNPSSAAVAAFQVCSDRYRKFLNGQHVTRGTLIDYLFIAKIFPPSDPMRGSRLPFSYARTISRIASPQERNAWRQRVLQEGLSVERLQRAINAAGSGHDTTASSGHDTAAGSGHSPKKRQHILLCAATGNAIRDLEAMIELRLYLEPAQQAAFGCVRRGGAARLGRSQQQQVAHPCRLYFESCAALAAWLTEHQIDGTPAPNTQADNT